MIIGVDEVGRGAWAGPLVVGAVLLGEPVEGLKDSKLLSKNQREKLAVLLNEKASFVGLGWVSASEVDDLGLTKATSLACGRALKGAPMCEKILIDGKINYLPNVDVAECIIDGDASVPAISAASIVAKVARDEFMAKQDQLYPGYGFASNVGYGTKSHREAIQAKGLTPIHRWSYKPILNHLNTYEA